METRYDVKCWRSTEHNLTAKELYDRVMSDSERSNYNWIACATELVRVCNEPNFPQEYAQDIKVAILDCFAELTASESGGYKEPTDDEAVHFCFNSLSGTNENIRFVKHKYLKAIIKAARRNHSVFFIYWGDVYNKLCNEWEKAKFEEFSAEENIDFTTFYEEMHDDFKYKLQAAEELGVFEADRKKHKDWIISIMSKLR